MKFESKIGIGEVVVTRQRFRDDVKGIGQNIHNDLIGEVVSITFERDALPMYAVRIISNVSIPSVQYFREWELEGDPAFDQETGAYPE